ncbi:MAG TPA: Crp/Fnr family transcriptional regulator [Bacteroidales bacterium]|nr:Crp/Fnr family transcriptional regulator [Bacteroidales bacterium]
MDYNILSQSPLFKNMSADDIELTLSHSRSKVRKYKEGSFVYSCGEQVNALAIVVSGYVKGEMTDFTGRVIKIEDIKAAGAIAPAFMFGKNNRYPVNVIAVVDTEVLIIDKPDFLSLLNENNLLLVNFLDMISNRSQFLSDKIRFLSFKTIKSKLAQYILELAGQNKTEVRLDRTQNDLADYFGVARPSVGRALGDLEESGIIETNGKNITILKRDELAGLIAD